MYRLSNQRRITMSKIEVHESLQVAHKVLRAIEKIMPKRLAGDCRVESWSNGREQGLCLENYSSSQNGILARKIVFAEDRASDDILVVNGSNYDFDVQTNQPSDETWKKNRRYFKYDQHAEVAEYIVKLLQ
jgi:hypothetical protein